jgi:tubulin-specific chaperone D
VRGYNVVVGFFNNEPRYLEPILRRLEHVTRLDNGSDWDVSYVLLLWLSHLMLTPFDLRSISPPRSPDDAKPFPTLAERSFTIAVHFITSSTKAQDAAAILILRLVTRPDMVHFQSIICDPLMDLLVVGKSSDTQSIIYERLGPLRYFAGCAKSAEMANMIPRIYEACWSLINASDSPVATNAVGKKLTIKVFRNTVITALRSASNQTSLLPLLTETSLVEDVIDYLLSSLGDRDTPVRYAAAKALSRLVLELDPAMGSEVVQAVLGSFMEDMPKSGKSLDFRSANALKWHGLTLALGHILLKRSATVNQVPDIVKALVSALQFEQRTATGSSVGTNVRDAANFGFWALSRRYSTDELLSVDKKDLKSLLAATDHQSIIQALAIQLVLAACLDPVGNIRRGSSAALQELVGRHPDQVTEGISLVQIVDYQAVSLRHRAMVDVAGRVVDLADPRMEYWTALVDGLFGWRGLGSSDVSSRKSAAAAFAQFSKVRDVALAQLMRVVKQRWFSQPTNPCEENHGFMLSMAALINEANALDNITDIQDDILTPTALISVSDRVSTCCHKLGLRELQSEVSVAAAKLLTALCSITSNSKMVKKSGSTEMTTLCQNVTRGLQSLLDRRELAIQDEIPALVRAYEAFRRKISQPPRRDEADALVQKVARHGSQGTLHAACSAIALGAFAAHYDHGLNGQDAIAAVAVLADLVQAANLDWRVIGIKALRLAIEPLQSNDTVDSGLAAALIDAVHRGLNDYTIDERGDVGSLVRLQAIKCTSCILFKPVFADRIELVDILRGDIYRLSMEKLDRVRLEAAKCRGRHLDLKCNVTDVSSVSSKVYFSMALAPLRNHGPSWQHRCVLEGSISCAGITSEPILQASRSALVDILDNLEPDRLKDLLSVYTAVLKALVLESSNNVQAALDLLSFLLDMQLPQQLVDSDFKWLNLLSAVQKSHFKSNDIPKILSAVQAYRGLAEVPPIRGEVLKKLITMLRTNPYPRVRVEVTEALFLATKNESLRAVNWMQPTNANTSIVKQLQDEYSMAR